MKTLTKNLLIGILLTLLLVAFHTFLNAFNDSITDWPRFLKNSILYNGLYAIPFYLVNASAHAWARKKEVQINLSAPMFWLVYLIFIVLVNVLLAYVITVIANIIDNGWAGWSDIDSYFFISAFTISMIIGAFFYILFYIKAKFEKESAKQETKINQVTQTHEALKSQIGPHFLFNSLNVLSGLVDENPDRAQTFIADLAQVYRYVLDQKDKEWVPVAEEIDFAENYLALIKTRFEDGLHVEIEEGLMISELQMAPLTLQLLLENCIKHNAISKEKPLEIKIFKMNKTLIVENNLNPKKVFQEREGTGLNQIKQRYAFIDQEVKVTQSQDRFSVEVPLLQIEDLNA
ncbi:hypothetical protein GO491_05245 [Flavobacteriaceae bacterium Ap0902]|nr:hypothetical protein [Flavobacteriaceae bacterium Ap0902]